MDESALRNALAGVNDCGSLLHRELGFWTLIVVVGVALELVFVVWEYVEELHDFRRGIVHPPDKPNCLLFALGFFAAGLVALGVGGELYAESKIATAETCIRKGNDALFLLLSKEAGDAAKSAKTARDEADALTKEAADLRHQLRIQGPREVLLDEGGDEITRSLKPFAGQNLTVIGCGALPPLEEATLATGIVGLVGSTERGPGWSTIYKSWSPCWSLAFPGTLAVINTADASVENATKALVESLNKAGIASEQLPNSPSFHPYFETPGSPFALARQDPTRIFLLVGPNPMAEVQKEKKNKASKPVRQR